MGGGARAGAAGRLPNLAGWSVRAGPEPGSRSGPAQPAMDMASAVPEIAAVWPLDATTRRRLAWSASGLALLAWGVLALPILHPRLDATPDLNTALYATLVIWLVGTGALALGLGPARPPAWDWRWLAGLALLLVALCAGIIELADMLPRLVHADQMTPDTTIVPVSRLTGWHWGMTSLPLAVALLVSLALLRRGRQQALRPWLLAAVACWSAGQVLQLVRPVAARPTLSPAILLTGLAAALLALGYGRELHRLADLRLTVLTQGWDDAARQHEVALLHTEITTIIAHELASPLAAMPVHVQALAKQPLDPTGHTALSALAGDIALIRVLAGDLAQTVAIETEMLAVKPVPLALDQVLTGLAGFACSLPGKHAVSIPTVSGLRVLADPVRIDQVLRNLLGNAAKYAPAGSPITVRLTPTAERVEIAVIDQGPGIGRDEADRLCAKFARGETAVAEGIPGSGLGLYLARLLISAHGSSLTLASAATGGAIASFSLERLS